MEILFEAVKEGITQFGGKIIAGILLIVFCWAFPKLKSLVEKGPRKDEAEMQKALEIYHTLHKQEEDKKAEEEKRQAEIQRELELKRQEEERLKAELQQREEALRLAEAQKAEESKRRAEIEKELEEKRREEALKQAQAQEDTNKLIVQIILCAALIIILIASVVFHSLKSSSTRDRTETKQQISQTESTSEPTNVKAQNELGDKYYNDKNYEQAVYWYRKAAEQGNAYAQFNLGDMYEYGKGVKKDYSEALKWYSKAAEQGHTNAKKAAERIQKLMK